MRLLQRSRCEDDAYRKPGLPYADCRSEDRLIYLDNTTRKIQAVLAGSVSANQPKAQVYFYDVPSQKKDDFGEYRGASKYTDLNNSTDVDICAAPMMTATVRNVETIIIYNADTAAVVLTVKMDDATAESILVKKSLAAGETLIYEDKAGWQVF